MKKNDYQLIERNVNKVTKFLNFKNFDKNKFKDIDMYDLLFKYKKMKNKDKILVTGGSGRFGKILKKLYFKKLYFKKISSI